MKYQILKVVLLVSSFSAVQSYAHDYKEYDVSRNGHGHGHGHGDGRLKEGRFYDAIANQREALNRERQNGHRYFDEQMRELDRRNQDIDQWQQSHSHRHHQDIARIANEKRDHLNRERERINRERDRMNREFDERNRELDRLSQKQHEWRGHNRRQDYGRNDFWR